MIKFYKLTGSEDSIRRARKQLKGEHIWVRDLEGIPYTRLNPDHSDWLTKFEHELSIQFVELPVAPAGIRIPRREEYTSACKEFTTQDPIQKTQHERDCPKCREIEGRGKRHYNRKADHNSRTRTIARIAPNQPFNLNGVIASLEVTKDELYEHLSQVESTLENLKKYRDSKDSEDKILKEKKERLDAVRQVVSELN